MKHVRDVLKGRSEVKVKVTRDPFDTKMRPPSLFRRTVPVRWGLVRRILKSKVGRPWSEVHAYLRALPYPAGEEFFVYQHVELVGSVPCVHGYPLYDALYVCPLTHTLQYWAKPRRKIRVPQREKESTTSSFIQIRGLTYYYVNSQWYCVKTVPWASNTWDYFYGKILTLHPYNEPVLVQEAVAVDKRTARRLTRKYKEYTKIVTAARPKNVV